MSSRSGQCLCGAVRFNLSAEPVAARICWCRDCLHYAGNGTVNAMYPAEAVTVSGSLAEYARRADSGNTVTRQFCPTCGTHLFAMNSARPHLRVVRVGNLDDPSSVAPAMNMWAASAPVWACLDEALERVDGQPGAPRPAPQP